MMERKKEWLKRLVVSLTVLSCMASVLLVRELYWITRTETVAPATVFDTYIRRRDGITSYIRGDAFTALPENCHSEVVSGEGAMRITVSNTPCDGPPSDPRASRIRGWYFVEAWFDWLEIPAIRGEDVAWARIEDGTYAENGYSMVIRYMLEGDPTEYTAIYDGDLYGESFTLPEGRLTALQIYVSVYMCVRTPDLERTHSVSAQYRHAHDVKQNTENGTRYYHFHNIHYVPSEEE